MRHTRNYMRWIIPSLLLCALASRTPAQSWDPLPRPADGDCYAGAFADSLNGVAVTITAAGGGISTDIRRTEDGGASWSPAYTLEGGIFGVASAGQGKMFAAGNNLTCNCGAIYASTDKGSTWGLGQIFSQATPALWSIHFLNSATGFVGGDDGVLMKTTDGGTSWTPLVTGVSGVIRSIHFVDEEHGFVVVAQADNYLWGEKVFKTTDGGATWSNSPVPNFMPMVVHFITPEIGFVGGWSNGPVIKKTTNGGASWVSVYNGSDNESFILSLQFTSSYAGYAGGGRPNVGAGTRGLIVSTTDGGRSWNEDVPSNPTTIRWIDFPVRTVGYAFGDGGAVLKTDRAGITDPRPGIVVDRDAVAFGTVGVGDDETKSITILSQTLAPLEVSSIELLDTTSPSGLSFTTSMSLPATLNESNFLTVSLKFRPTALGDAAGRLVIRSNADSAATLSIPITAQGGPPPQPTAMIFRDTIPLGNVNLGRSIGTSIEVMAANGAGLVVDSVYLIGSSIDQMTLATQMQLPAALGKKESMFMSVTFAPVREESLDAALVIRSNDAASPLRTIPITGRGVGISSAPDAYESMRSHVGATIEPNPARDVATLRLDLPRGGPLRVELFDERGARAMALPVMMADAGAHELAIDARNLPAGIYHCRVAIGDVVIVRRFIVMR